MSQITNIIIYQLVVLGIIFEHLYTSYYGRIYNYLNRVGSEKPILAFMFD